MAPKITAASDLDRAQVKELAAAVQATTSHHLQVAFVDRGCTGSQPTTEAAQHGAHLQGGEIGDKRPVAMGCSSGY